MGVWSTKYSASQLLLALGYLSRFVDVGLDSWFGRFSGHFALPPLPFITICVFSSRHCSFNTMDGFGDNFDQAEVDPAADFIAREQNELAGLDDVIAPAPSSAAVPVVTNGKS